MNAGSGHTSPKPLAEWRHDPGCSCSRTSPGCSLSTGGQPYPRLSDRYPNWGTWDATGFTALPKPELPTSASAGSALLPTPVAGNFNDGESLASWEARRQKNYAKRINGNGQGTPLPIALLKLLPTPWASDGPHGGPQQTGTGLVPIITKLFPTPTEACGKGGQVSRSGARKGEKLLNDPV